jgi:hypothetical protein
VFTCAVTPTTSYSPLNRCVFRRLLKAVRLFASFMLVGRQFHSLEALTASSRYLGVLRRPRLSDMSNRSSEKYRGAERFLHLKTRTRSLNSIPSRILSGKSILFLGRPKFVVQNMKSEIVAPICIWQVSNLTTKMCTTSSQRACFPDH